MGGRLTVAAVALAAVPFASASASESASPAPTVATATYAAGQELPLSLLRGQWHSSSTVANTLTIGGQAASGTRSVADATWTSSWGWATPRKAAFHMVIDVQQKPLLPGIAPSSWSYTLQYRSHGGGWVMDRTSVSQPYDPIITPEWIVTDTASFRSRTYLQFRVTFHADFQSTTNETVTVSPRIYLGR